MVIAIEYMSDFFVGPVLSLNPNLSGSSSSGGDQRTVLRPVVVDVLDVALVEFRSPATLVSPTSARQAQSSSEMRIFAYTKLSFVVWKRDEESYSFQITVGEFHAMEIL